MYGYFKRELKDLKEIDGLYYVGDIYDVDGNPWLEAKDAQEILDMVNQANLKAVIEHDEVVNSLTIKH